MANLLRNGVPARGLVLSASSVGYERTVQGLRCEARDVVLDIEVPGQAPYEISVTAILPRIVEAFPGVALDLRVNPNDPNDILVIGPVGSSDWLAAAPWLGPAPGIGARRWQPGMVPGATPGRRTGVTMLVVLGGVILFLFSIGFAVAMHASRDRATHSPPPASHPTPPPHKPPAKGHR